MFGSIEVQLALLFWGTLVGLDLVSVGQTMISRPLVAGAVAGAIVGDLPTGLQLGIVFELFQFDVLPVGAARYPEYGPATVAAVSAAHFSGGALATGIGAGVGLLTGLLGGVSLDLLRQLNVRAVARAAPLLDAGETDVLIRVHVGGILRDAARAALVTAVGLILARIARTVFRSALTTQHVTLMAAAVAGAAVAVGAAGVLRLMGRTPTLKWFALGLMGGSVVAWTL
ncbi:MAG TPA: PTS sugar transporter subunit IIC [Gemmatimonadales bacterium]|nr:PTS sugar transporter subunit IIC [Gemmatimonadales bacterium]